MARVQLGLLGQQAAPCRCENSATAAIAHKAPDCILKAAKTPSALITTAATQVGGLVLTAA